MAAKVVIGLTGNIATGKSLVLRMLQELGATVIDADKLNHQLMVQGNPLYQAIVEEFGKFVLGDDGQINRARLGRIVFSDPAALARLEEISHPLVRQEILKRIDQANTPVAVIEAIKLFESRLAEECHSNWVVTAPPEMQFKRLVERRKMEPAQAQQRIKVQPSQEEKIAKADVVIDNSGDLARTWAFVKKQYTNLMQTKTGTTQPMTETSETPVAETPVRTSREINLANITIRRAKRHDLQAMAELISKSTHGMINPDLNQMMESLFTRAYLVAMAGEYLVGIAGWQTENLIAGLQDFYVLREDMWAAVGQKMLSKIHEEVNSLSCEVSLAFVLNQAGPKPVQFFESQGYEQSESKDLGYMWKDAAMEWQPENSVLLYKKLREQRIMVPM
jgi:dephospho-CoA kinase